MQRELAEVIAKPLEHLWSWRIGEVLEDWRKVSVTPVYKKAKEVMQSYKPDSLTSVPGK